MAPPTKDDAILAAMLKSFDSETKKVDMTAFATNMGYGNLGSASNTFTRMKAKYGLQVERVTLSGAGSAGSRAVRPITKPVASAYRVSKTIRPKKSTTAEKASRSSSPDEESAEEGSAEEKGEMAEKELEEDYGAF